MRDSLRQVRALAGLLMRHFSRRAVKAGANPTQAKVPSFVLLSLVWAAYVGNAVWNLLDRAAHAEDHVLEAIGWQLGGILIMLVGFGLGELTPELGRLRSPLRASLLDELPVTTAARVGLSWVRNPLLLALPILSTIGWSPPLRGHGSGVALLVAIGLLLGLAALTWGYALATWVRVAFSARGRRAIAIGSFVLAIAGFPLVSTGTSLRAHSPGRALVALARAIHDGEGAALALAALALCLVAALAAIGLGELKGYDRLDAASAGQRKAGRVRLTLDAAERVLAHREGGLVLLVIEWLILGGIAIAAGFAFVHAPGRDTVKQLSLGYALLVAYMGALLALNQAGAAVRRDAGVRALLAPLPLSPYDTLAGKVRVLRRLLLPLLLTAVPLAAVTLRHAGTFGVDVTSAVLWRAAATLAVVWLAADASVSVAFLTNGVGLPGTRSLGAPTSYAAQLLLLPMLATASAANPVVALASVGTVGAVTFEARRAARKCVRWLDDAADDVERETTVWRALLALAAFFAVQALGAQFLRLGQASPAVTLAVTYGVAAVALVILTVQGRRLLGPLVYWPKRVVAVPLGLVAGTLSGAAAMGFGRLVDRFAPSTGPELDLSAPGARVWLFAALVVLAPLAEETFFRGWLQDAIAADLPPVRRRWAFAIAAIAFAFAHVGGYAVPQLMLGLVAGALYAWSGGLLPGIVAHAAHNGLVLLLGGG
jgi:membrane protease YdiL (CAAX protease family)